MFVRSLSLTDFRSWQSAELNLDPGVTAIVGANGQGKTNLLEALGYLATLGSHRVSTEAALVRHGSERAQLQATVVHAGRELTVQLEIAPGRTNRARINRSPARRPREVLGILRTVLFAPEDLSLVRGDPAERRRFIDDLLVTRSPGLAALRGDYDKVVRQRTALLKSCAGARRAADLSTLDAWDGHLARHGAQLMAARQQLLAALEPQFVAGYSAVAGSGAGTRRVGLEYRSSLGEPGALDPADLESAMLAELSRVRDQELDRGVCLVGPHRDDLDICLDDTVAKNFASQGESWSLALALRLGSYEMLRADGAEPVLLLDDVFAELDRHRRARLARVAAAAEQVLVTAAVQEDLPDGLDGTRIAVQAGEAHRVT